MRIDPGDRLLVLSGPYRGQMVTVHDRYDKYMGMSWLDMHLNGSSASSLWADQVAAHNLLADEEVYCVSRLDSSLTFFVHRSQMEAA